MSGEACAVGIDLGGTKIECAMVDAKGKVRTRVRVMTEAQGGPAAVCAQLVRAVGELRRSPGVTPRCVGVGVAGQVTAGTGVVRFAPNLDWHDVPLREELARTLNLPVAVTNDVRAATWGEWLHGAGKGCDELVCVFVGTGVGGGLVANGRVVEGAGNSAGEVGHMTVDLTGPSCHCGNRGCLEALAGGWAIGRRAREAASADPKAGAALLRLAGGRADEITAKEVALAYGQGDPLASRLVAEAAEALVAGAASVANAFNPARLILGGGVVEGLPDLVERVKRDLPQRALATAAESVEVVRAELGGEAGVVGAAAYAFRTFRQPT